MAVKINCTKNGTDYYRVTATVGRDSNGKPIRKEFYGKGKKDAEDKRDEYLSGIKNGLNINYKTAAFGQLLHTWLFEVARVKVKASSFERYEGIYRNYIANSDIFGMKLADIKTLQIQRYYNELYENGKSSSVIHNLHKLIRTFFTYAVNEDYVLKNPCTGGKVIIPKEDTAEETEVEIFTDEEIDLLKGAMEGHKLQYLILTALGTGLRQGELLALKWDDIDFESNQVKVTKTLKTVKVILSDGSGKRELQENSPKSKTSNRVVPLPTNLANLLKEHMEQQTNHKNSIGDSYKDKGYVFTTEFGNPLLVKNLFNSYKRLLAKAGVPHKKFHALRHTYASKLFQRKVDLKTVQTLLGHSDLSITANIYTHVMPKDKISAVETLNDLFN
jgi:integrase